MGDVLTDLPSVTNFCMSDQQEYRQDHSNKNNTQSCQTHQIALHCLLIEIGHTFISAESYLLVKQHSNAYWCWTWLVLAVVDSCALISAYVSVHLCTEIGMQIHDKAWLSSITWLVFKALPACVNTNMCTWIQDLSRNSITGVNLKPRYKLGFDVIHHHVNAQEKSEQGLLMKLWNPHVIPLDQN